MTGELLTEWVSKLNIRIKTADRKIVLIIDNCDAHPTVELSNIELVFLPP